MPGGHRYVKPTKRTTAPYRMLVASAELPFRLELVTDGECYYSAEWVWATDNKRNGTTWKGSAEPSRYHPDDWWEHVAALASKRVRLFVVCIGGFEFLTVTGFWRQLERRTFVLRESGDCNSGDSDSGRNPGSGWVGRYVCGGPPDIITVRANGGTICVVSLRNYTEASWHQLALAVSGLSGGSGYGTGIPADDYSCPVRQGEIATGYMRQLISGWVERRCGGWAETTAQLSVRWWRNSFYTERVCRHADPVAIDLERKASYGGRNAVWFFGDVGDRSGVPDGSDPMPPASEYPTIPGAIYRCDVTSQYPAILATRPFPTRLMGTTGPISVADLKALLNYFGVIANVRVRTGETEIPSRPANESIYRSGTFTTTIAGPELEYAIDRGWVVGVRETAYYQLGFPLKAYATHLLRERDRTRRASDYAGELFAKSLSTTIGGKFSQRTTRREPCPSVVNPFSQWGPFTQVGADGIERHYTTVAGLCLQEVASQSGSKLLAAVYCYLTSYGRVQMAEIRESMLPVVPFAQCTDGIWVGASGIDRLRRLGLSTDRTPGILREVSQHCYSRWFSPNHYYCDGKWTLSGYRTGCTVLPSMEVVEFRDVNPVRTVAWKAPSAVLRRAVQRSLSGVAGHDRIGADGWVTLNQKKG